MIQPLQSIRMQPEGLFIVRVPWSRIIALAGGGGEYKYFESKGFSFRVVRLDKILPDIDTGPEGWQREENDPLLTGEGLWASASLWAIHRHPRFVSGIDA